MEEARDTRLLPQRNEIGGWDDHSRAALGRLGFGLDGARGRGERSEGERGAREWANHPTLPFATALNGAARLMGMAER